MHCNVLVLRRNDGRKCLRACVPGANRLWDVEADKCHWERAIEDDVHEADGAREVRRALAVLRLEASKSAAPTAPHRSMHIAKRVDVVDGEGSKRHGRLRHCDSHVVCRRRHRDRARCCRDVDPVHDAGKGRI